MSATFYLLIIYLHYALKWVSFYGFFKRDLLVFNLHFAVFLCTVCISLIQDNLRDDIITLHLKFNILQSFDVGEFSIILQKHNTETCDIYRSGGM